MLLESLIGAIVTAAVGALLAWLSSMKDRQTDIDNAVKLATQQAMLTSTAQAQAVQTQMEAAVSTLPQIVDVATAQAAFGVGLVVPLVKKLGLLAASCLLLVTLGCHKVEGGAVGQHPTIDNPPPPAEMFSSPETPLTPREKAAMIWSAALYKRVTVYNLFAVQSNTAHGYYAPPSTPPIAPDTTIKARRMFE